MNSSSKASSTSLGAEGRPWLRDAIYATAAVLAIAVATFAIPDYRAYEWTLWACYGILALSFTFVWGHGGIFSFGQAAFFGIGAYAYGVAGINLSPSTGETLSAVVIGMVVAATCSALLGYFMFYGNVGDVYVAIITLAVTLVLLTVTSSMSSPAYHIGDALLGGYNGMVGIPPLMIGSGIPLDTRQMFLGTALVAATVAMFLRILYRRPFGRVIAAVRENELRTQLLGYDVRRYKLAAFTLAGGIAGLGGTLYAAWGLFLNPSVFSLGQAALVAIWVLVGGRTSLLGAFVGVAVVQGLSSGLGSGGGQWTPIVLGGVLIAVVLLVPEGAVPTATALLRRLRRRGTPPVAVTEAGDVDTAAAVGPAPDQLLAELMSVRPHGGPPLSLEGIGLVKRFGGVRALNGVDINVPAGQTRALIGPNGAGKSTCFNLLVGRHSPTEGRVLVGDRDVTRMRADARARLGVGIKIQVPCYYAELTVAENLWVASYRTVRNARLADQQVQRALSWLRLGEFAHLPARVLSHGQHQWLEIGMVVASAPAVMLLDEPTAGMTRQETMLTVEMIRTVSEHTTVVVVEHDMEFLRQLDAPVTMFHQGEVFAQGSIEELRQDDRVLDTYLGRAVVVDAAN